MTPSTTQAAQEAPSDHPATLEGLAAYLAKEADFNRSWIDGRRSNCPGHLLPASYVAGRIAAAKLRDAWVSMIESQAAELASLRAEVERLKDAGRPLATIAFGLKQRAGRVLTTHEAEALRNAQVAWDAAIANRPNRDPT